MKLKKRKNLKKSIVASVVGVTIASSTFISSHAEKVNLNDKKNQLKLVVDNKSDEVVPLKSVITKVGIHRVSMYYILRHDSNIKKFELYRNNELIHTVSSEEDDSRWKEFYYDSDLEASTSYEYKFIAVEHNGDRYQFGEVFNAKTKDKTTKFEPAQVRAVNFCDMGLDAINEKGVHLHVSPTDSYYDEIDHAEIYRDGKRIATTYDFLYYQDKDVEANVTYNYSVRLVSKYNVKSDLSNISSVTVKEIK